MKKAKNLKKRIRRLEARLQKDAKKLARLKRKLEAAEKTVAAKPKKAGKASKASGSINKKNQRLPMKANGKPAAAVKELGAVKKVKRKLNLTPERRAQLAAAMKARWVAKRAAAATNTQHSSSGPGFHPGDASRPQ
jgi:chromosome segregation ATPase